MKSSIPSFLLLCSIALMRVNASPARIDGDDFPITKAPVELHRRQTWKPGNATCGFRDGNTDLPWIANEGQACAVDFEKGYFGFCATTITDFASCPIAVACADRHSYTERFGRSDATSVLSCVDDNNDYCYHNLLYSGSQTFTLLGCEGNGYRSWIYSAAENVITETPSASTISASTPSPVSASTTAGVSASATASSTLTPSSSSNSSSSSSNNTGAIVGGVVGGLAVLTLAGLGFFFLRRKKQNNASKSTAQTELDTNPYAPPQYVGPTDKYAYRPVEPEQPPAELPTTERVSEMQARAESPREM